VWHIAEMHECGEAGVLEWPVQPLDGVLPARFCKLYSGTGTFETYICKGCGFTEWYAHGLDKLEADPKHGVRLLDGRVEDEGPYR